MFKIPKTRSIMLLRRNVEELIMAAIKESWKIDISSHVAFLYVDEIIEWFENAGVYEHSELRDIIINNLKELKEGDRK